QFGASRSVAFGIIEEIDPSIVGFNHQRLGHIVGHLVTERDPGSKRKLTYFDPGSTKSAVFHMRCYACTYLPGRATIFVWKARKGDSPLRRGVTTRQSRKQKGFGLAKARHGTPRELSTKEKISHGVRGGHG